ncbi:MAG: hypothetical protein KDA52_24760, partial [Planctomycetaceae bacterium]|nr:hypothetical protein [Planctomycetaceae bacterium]
GTVIKCTATFDNSEGNPNNPAPDETVSWGEQSWEEMMIGFFQYQLPKDSKDIQALKPRRRRGRD